MEPQTSGIPSSCPFLLGLPPGTAASTYSKLSSLSSLLKWHLLLVLYFSEWNQCPPSCLNQKLVLQPGLQIFLSPYQLSVITSPIILPPFYDSGFFLFIPAAASLAALLTAFLKLMFGCSTTPILKQLPPSSCSSTNTELCLVYSRKAVNVW